MKFFVPTPTGCDATASQSQNSFFREIGFSAEKRAQLVCLTSNKKTVYILLKALQITFPTQKSDRKSVKRFLSYCPKTLRNFAKNAGNRFQNRLWRPCFSSFYPQTGRQDGVSIRAYFAVKNIDDVTTS